MAALPLIAAGVSAAGTLVGGYNALQQGKYQSGVDQQNAALEREAAEQSLKQGYQERVDYWRKVGNVKGQQVASMAANGIDVGYGTAARIQGDTQMLANEDAANLYQNIKNRTRGFVINSYNDQMDARAARAAGTAALVGSVFNAGSSILGGVSQMQSLKAKLGTSYAGNG
jgi:hypothetical protein